MNEPKCRLCGSSNLTAALHEPRFSKVRLTIAQCRLCNLVQGNVDERAYAVENDTYRDPALMLSVLSCDSPYSNIRVGKQQMADKFFNIIQTLPLDVNRVKSVIDVRSARGSFILKAPLYFTSSSTFVGLEEDLYLHPPKSSYDTSVVSILDYSVYSFPKPSQAFDFVYSCHTLEHYRDPNRYVQSIKGLLSNEGYFFVDVPSLPDFIDDNILDDFFYDKHLLYFTEATLTRLLRANGFTILWRRSSGNGCIEVLAQIKDLYSDKGVDESELAVIQPSQITAYSQRLSANRARLPAVSQNITQYISTSGGRTVAFGAGRILDAFRVYGNLDTRLFDYYVDNYLSEASQSVNGLPIQRLSDLQRESDLTFILFTRHNTKSLAALITTLHPLAAVFHWADFENTHQPHPV